MTRKSFGPVRIVVSAISGLSCDGWLAVPAAASGSTVVRGVDSVVAIVRLSGVKVAVGLLLESSGERRGRPKCFGSAEAWMTSRSTKFPGCGRRVQAEKALDRGVLRGGSLPRPCPTSAHRRLGTAAMHTARKRPRRRPRFHPPFLIAPHCSPPLPSFAVDVTLRVPTTWHLATFRKTGPPPPPPPTTTTGNVRVDTGGDPHSSQVPTLRPPPPTQPRDLPCFLLPYMSSGAPSNTITIKFEQRKGLTGLAWFVFFDGNKSTSGLDRCRGKFGQTPIQTYHPRSPGLKGNRLRGLW